MPFSLDESISTELEALAASGLLRTLKTRGRGSLDFSTNDYLGLASHPTVIRAACAATEEWGGGSTGSRLLSGNLPLHEQLEKELARFKGTEQALLFNSGYSANLSLLAALTGSEDRVVCDKLNHASLIDGCRQSEAEVRYFRHGDWDRAEELLAGGTSRRRFLVLESVYSMDGDVAPLPRVLEICRRYDAVLILDEAHSTGVLGADGRGIFEHFGIRLEDTGLPGLILMGTLGKALGSFGAFVAASRPVCELLLNRARPLIFSTALPPSALGSAVGALKVLQTEPDRVRRLRENSRLLRELLRIPFLDSTPIIPVILGEPERALAVSRALGELGLQVPAIRPPTVPAGTSRLRISLGATHSEKDLEKLAGALRQLGVTP